MATVSLDVPPEIVVEIPPSTLWAELVDQPQRVTARSPQSGFDINDPVWPVSQDIATTRGRLMSAYYGTVQLGMGHVLVGSPNDRQSQKSAKIITDRARAQVQTERYGPKSFIQKFLPGKLSTLNVEVLHLNWTLDARICQFAVEGEDEAAIAIRDANREVYLQGVEDLEWLWEREYTQAFKTASSAAAAARGLKKERLERARDLYEDMKDAPPKVNMKPPNGGPDWVSALECEQAKLVPFIWRTKTDRLRKYEEYFTKNVVASHYSTVMGIVDIRRLAENSNIPGVPPFWSMIVNQWVNACDLILKHIVDPQASRHRELCMVDASLRKAANNWSDNRLECYNRIRHLFNGLGYNVGYGEWEDIPILRVDHQGRKRARTDE